MLYVSIPFVFVLLAVAVLPAAESAPVPAGYKPVYEQTFDKPESVKDLLFLDPAVWKHVKSDTGGFMEVAYDRKTYKAPREPKHRSPYHMAMIADKVFTDFVMDLEMASTTPPYPHQDLCLFCGYESPEKYYYTHIAVATDDRAHNVFIVNNAPRVKISKETTKGVEWGLEKWHKVRLVREGSTGKIEVFFDDMSRPIMRAEDKSFPKGLIGFGTFDDAGRFCNVKVYSPSLEEKKNDYLQPLK